MRPAHFQKLIFFVLLPLLLSACASEPEPRQVAAQVAQAVDFSGAWEIDYSQSENVREAFDVLIRELQRQAERRARNMSQGGGTLSTGGGGVNSGASIYALARMAEIVTEPQLLDIDQSENHITVKRDGSIALTCDFRGGGFESRESVLGDEVCGWDGHQLLFQVYLPDGLTIYHRFTLGPGGERINIATTLRSDQVGSPFALDRVYRRYDPNASGIRCKQTLTKGRVCTTEQPR